MSTPAATEPGRRERIFITGGSGYIGSVVIEFAVAEGYEVHALSRSEKSDAKLKGLGAVPVRGTLESQDVLRRESTKADIVLHLANALSDDFGVDYKEVLRIDAVAVDAIGDALQGTSKPFVNTSGSLVVLPDPTGAETTESSPPRQNAVVDRLAAEKKSLELCEKGVNVSVIRLAPYVYGRGASGVGLFMQMHAKNGEVTYVDEGKICTSAIHVDDSARLFLLAAKKAKAGDVFNGTSSTDTTLRQMAEAMGATLKMPVRSITFEELAARTGEFFATFITTENRASSAKAVRELEWQPREPGILEDIRTGSYVAVAEGLRKNGA